MLPDASSPLRALRLSQIALQGQSGAAWLRWPEPPW
ncbi:hypothetical protein AZ54_16740 [Xanthomonas oryzae pv. oryzae PXO86]|nr:hypothetical protein AZ54_16740 [Xanthomonas oryzae pv. oryzae PXO86]